MEEDLVRLSAFLGATYLAGKLVALLRSSPLLGHITSGALLGAPLADFAPVPRGLQLAGLAGVTLSVISAGLLTDLATLRARAPRALAVAVTGIALPLAGGAGAVLAAHALRSEYDPRATPRAAIAAGAALAPTSLGVVAPLLAEVGELHTPLGQLISIAAVLDDVLSLVLLAEVAALAGEDNPAPWAVCRPLVFSVVFIVVGVAAAWLLPYALRAVAKVVPEHRRAVAALWMVLVLATLGVWAANEAETSFLLAAYLVGIAFASVPAGFDVREVWAREIQRFEPFLVMLFFAATIGFVIPIRVLFEPGALALGAALGVVAIVGKLICGLLAPDLRRDGLAVGVAMLGRGEFGFLIAAEAQQLGLLEREMYYPAVIWGVLLPTLITPWVFGPVYHRRKAKMASHGERGNP